MLLKQHVSHLIYRLEGVDQALDFKGIRGSSMQDSRSASLTVGALEGTSRIHMFIQSGKKTPLYGEEQT